MRYKNLIGFVWVAVIMGLFTSCLKDINNVYNPGTTAAVVRQHKKLGIIRSPAKPIVCMEV